MYTNHLATTKIWETKVSPWVEMKRKDMRSEHMFFSALRRFGEAYLRVHCVTVSALHIGLPLLIRIAVSRSEGAVLIQFHVMKMPEHFTADDLRPGSEALEDWRASILNHPKDLSPIAVCMRANQMAFNGSSAQETSDQLFLALIHPQMPTYYVCANDTLWDRFIKTVINYDKDQMDLAAPSARLPAVLGPRPFYMNLDGHTKYLHHVLTYRCFNVLVYQDCLQAAHELGLFLPNAIIQPNGSAELPGGASPKTSVKATLCADHNQKLIKAPNFLITIGKIKCYTPFTAQPGPTWKQGVHCLLSVVGLNTIPDTIFWQSYKITKTSAPKRRKVEVVEDIENANPVAGIMTQSQKKLASVSAGLQM
ncbi:hypothetical protein C8R44DRAFT_734898 [Mycena epipterygia]|nr:hypothetical protein C8R44DRAFT_734898 [Mycena epipterygia]